MQVIVGMIIVLAILVFSLFILNDKFNLFTTQTSYECPQPQTSDDCRIGEMLVPGKYTGDQDLDGDDEPDTGETVRCCKKLG